MLNLRNLSSAAFGILTVAATADAQIPIGPETRVSTGLTGNGGVSSRPSVTPPAPDGSFVVVWTKVTPPYDFDIVARRYDAAGRPIGPEFLVNSYTTGRQAGPSISADPAGNFVVVWTSYYQGAGRANVIGQRFDASGARLGAEFQVNQVTGLQKRTAVSATSGGFVVSWFSQYAYALFGRRYDAAGAAIGGEFPVTTTTTTFSTLTPSIASAPNGDFVVVWDFLNPPFEAIRARLFAANGTPLGPEFQAGSGGGSSVGRDSGGAFVVAWERTGVADWTDIVARRFAANGAPTGAEFIVNAYTTGRQIHAEVAVEPDGDCVVVWDSLYQDGSETGVFGRRFAATGVGPEFRVNTSTPGRQEYPSVATDPAGNFVVTWQTWPGAGVDIQRYAGGLMGMEMSVDASAGPASDGNRVLEPGETVAVAPSWLNGDFVPRTVSGTISSFTGPGAPNNPTYSITDAAATYGTVANGSLTSCTADCYALGITVPSTRPATHWDATVREQLAPAGLGAGKLWSLHVGQSFADVPRSNGFYRFVETLLHNGVTGGCSSTAYCPASSTTREQMAVFVLVAKEGAGYVPPACVTPPFADVPASSPFCPWIAELARRAVVSGCGNGNYCPAAPVSRQEMAVYTLVTKEPGFTPPTCGATPVFNDVPASSPFCRWVEELARRGVVSGCGGGAYCPTAPVTREQMGVFLSVTFGLLLYGP